MNHHSTGGQPDDAIDIDALLQGLDDIFAANEAPSKAEPYLLNALRIARHADDDAAELSILNELMGFYRSQGRHDDNAPVIERALMLTGRMHLEGSEAWLSTLINAATSQRAAGNVDDSERLYLLALKSSDRIFDGNDRRLAALHNNLSMLYSSMGRYSEAEHHLDQALNILEQASVNPAEDIDVASSHSNLALLLLNTPSRTQESLDHAAKALEIYHQGGLETRAHFAAALAAYAQVLAHAGRPADSLPYYERALETIALHYGPNSEYYRTTEANLESVRALIPSPDQAHEAAQDVPAHPDAKDGPRRRIPHDGARPVQHGGKGSDGGGREGSRSITGMELSRAYWERYGKSLLAEGYPDYQGRIAAGLIGHGSECYGFDDAHSRDHDFGPGFCLWLSHEDFSRIGTRLQQDYEALPQEFLGFGPRETSVRARGSGRRVGVFEIGDFFRSITGYEQAPPQDHHAEWLMLDEATLAAATNGEIFADPFGRLSRTRQDFKLMPEDVRLALISKRLGMISQSGQYNLPRMLTRGDGAAAWLCIEQFTSAVSSLVFLLNTPIRAGYLPYYKWSFAALRRLGSRMGTRLPHLFGPLESLMRIASAACFGGHGTAEGEAGSEPAARQAIATIEAVCSEIVTALRQEGLSDSDETFLEWQRPYIEAHIHSADPCLHSI